MGQVAAALVALGGIIAAIAGLRRVSNEAEQQASSGWQGVATHLKERVTALEAAQERAEKEADEARETARELERKAVETEKRFVNLERDHLELVKLRRADQTRMNEMQVQLTAMGRQLKYYRDLVGKLVKQITDHGLEPVVRPDEEEANGGGQ